MDRPVTCKGACHKAFFERCPKWVCHRSYKSCPASEDLTPFIGVIIIDWNQWRLFVGDKADAYITNCPFAFHILDALWVISHLYPCLVSVGIESNQFAACGANHTSCKVKIGNILPLVHCWTTTLPGPCIETCCPLATVAYLVWVPRWRKLLQTILFFQWT